MATVTLRRTRDVRCATCGIPVDALVFDVSGIMPTPKRGQLAVLATLEFPAQYCGVLEYFSQFWTPHARDPARIRTEDENGYLDWTIRVNSRPLHPYLGLRAIVNPWGFGSFPVAVKLPEESRIELVVRNHGYGSPQGEENGKENGNAEEVGGRLVGRYWYDMSFGTIEGREC